MGFHMNVSYLVSSFFHRKPVPAGFEPVHRLMMSKVSLTVSRGSLTTAWIVAEISPRRTWATVTIDGIARRFVWRWANRTNSAAMDAEVGQTRCGVSSHQLRPPTAANGSQNKDNNHRNKKTQPREEWDSVIAWYKGSTKPQQTRQYGQGQEREKKKRRRTRKEKEYKTKLVGGGPPVSDAGRRDRADEKETKRKRTKSQSRWGGPSFDYLSSDGRGRCADRLPDTESPTG